MKVYTGAPSAARHYVETGRGRADDYYLTEGTGIARRYTAGDGRVQELTPLTGKGYEGWVAGVDPDTGAARGRLRTDDRAVRFVEVVVNGPKSWSLAAALHPEIATAYDTAQDRAATQIIGWLSQHATTRVGPAGGQVQVPVEVLEAVTVRHYASRAGDPHRHLHLHLQVNARVFAAGRWRGLHTVGVRDFLAAVNGVGHAAVTTDPQFRSALAAHGYTLEDTGEIQQLAGYVGTFSARAAQIGRNVNRYEHQWAAAHPGQIPGPVLRRGWDARAWAEGRPDKVTPQPGADLTDRWVGELAALGYRDRDQPLNLVPTPVGSIDRDDAAGTVLTRLAAGRSAWNAADVRGEVEQLIAAAGIVVDAGVRTELAEDLTARAMGRCVPLLDRDGVAGAVPGHIRAWTSQPVLDVEADLTARFAARSSPPADPREGPQPSVQLPACARLDPGQAAAAAALATDRPMVVIEGAAGAGKTTLLATTRDLLEVQGRRVTVVTPTLKAARVAAAEVGSATGSAAWLAFQHGWRWNTFGAWTRLTAGDPDPLTGGVYGGPAEAARLRAGDLLVIDEAGMLDQDTARALLTVADDHHVRVALLGDRHQLAAVGRGGVLDLAVSQPHPAEHLTLEAVHRFTHNDHTGQLAPDTEYAELTLAMRTGDSHGAVFDALVARGQIRLHPDAAALQQALATLTAAHHRDGERMAVVVDTREQAAELNAAIRERLVADGRVGDIRVAVTRAGQQIGAGDRVATRRNDRDLGVANRDAWTVTAIDEHGNITVSPDVTPTRTAAGRVTGHVTSSDVTPAEDSSVSTERRVLPPDYVAHHVELAYASTAHGVQGETVATAHVLIGGRTGAAAAYVGMTRGREANTAHLVADDLGQAREQWMAVFARERADLGPAHAAELAAKEAARYAEPRALEQVLVELHAAWTAEQRCQDRLDVLQVRREALRSVVAADADHADQQAGLENRHRETTIAVQEATNRAAAASAIVNGEADRLRDTLLDRWDTQREDARQAARIVLTGPGRLGLRRAAVHRAEQQLTDWADPWRPYLPTLPPHLPQLAVVASSADDRPGLQARLHDVARRRADSTHPELVWLRSTVDAAQAAHDHVSRALQDARRQRQNRLARLAANDRIDPATQLASAEREVTATERELAVARVHIAELAATPALLTKPAGRLAQERDDWRIRHDTERATRRAAASAASPPELARSIRPPEPVSRRTAVPGAGRGIGR